MRRTHLLAIGACLTATLAGGTAPAGAVSLIGDSTLDIAPNAAKTGFVYCATGEVDTTGRNAGGWTIRVSGVRGTTPYTPADFTTGAGRLNNGCPTVTKDGATGYLLFDVSYVAVGGEVLAHSTGFAQWGVAGDQTFAVDLTPA